MARALILLKDHASRPTDQKNVSSGLLAGMRVGYLARVGSYRLVLTRMTFI